mgnify:CR=1 FL=1
MQIKVVIHTTYGGFHLTDKMVELLKARESVLVANLPRTTRTNEGAWYHPDQDKESFRMHPDLIEVVEHLEAELDRFSEDTPWEERAELECKLLHGLKVSTVELDVDILEHDGNEHVEVRGYGY